VERISPMARGYCHGSSLSEKKKYERSGGRGGKRTARRGGASTGSNASAPLAAPSAPKNARLDKARGLASFSKSV